MDEIADDVDVISHDSAMFKLRVKLGDDGLVIRIDREPGQGLPLYETLSLTDAEANWLRSLLMDII